VNIFFQRRKSDFQLRNVLPQFPKALKQPNTGLISIRPAITNKLIFGCLECSCHSFFSNFLDIGVRFEEYLLIKDDVEWIRRRRRRWRCGTTRFVRRGLGGFTGTSCGKKERDFVLRSWSFLGIVMS